MIVWEDDYVGHLFFDDDFPERIGRPFPILAKK
jgi:hypothetical protein